MASFNTYSTGTPTVTALPTQGMVHLRLGEGWAVMTPEEAQTLSVELAAAAVQLGAPIILKSNADLVAAA